MRRPQREALTDVPERVTIYEVGPRDGLQNEKTLVPVEVKAEFILDSTPSRPRLSCRPSGFPSSPTPRRCSVFSVRSVVVATGPFWCPTSEV